MLSQTVFSEELIAKLTVIGGIDGPITIAGTVSKIIPPRLSVKGHESRASPSSLGALEILPPELLLPALGFLDFQSLSRFSRVCSKARDIVEALPAYRDIVIHAPEALNELGRARMLGYHSASRLRRTLRSEECVSCFDFGALLFLPTCERICYECLHQNRAFWVTTDTIAKECFHLTDAQLQRLPGRRRDAYGDGPRRRICHFVSVKQAKLLAIEVHGSPDEFAIHQASLESPSSDMSRLPEAPDATENTYADMGSIRFPYLTKEGADYGRRCRGCKIIWDEYRAGVLPASVLSELVPPGVPPQRPFRAFAYRWRSRDGLLGHLQQCYGVSRLLAKWGEPQVES